MNFSERGMKRLFYFVLVSGLFATAVTDAYADTQCPLQTCLSANGPANNADDCRCPSGTRKIPFRIQGGEQQFQIMQCGGRTIKVDEYWCEGSTSVTPAPTPTRTACSRAELLANFKWIHDDAAQTKKSAVMQGNILRFATMLDQGGVDEIRKAYKLAQSHNPPVAALIDKCDDLTVDQVAYAFAETYVRLRSCSGSRPAISATCSDYTENLRWGLLDSAGCAVYSRGDVGAAMNDTGTDLREKAYFIRRGFKYTQGHARDTALSIDFISDALLVQLTRDVWTRYQVGRLPGEPIETPNSITCPGVKLFFYWED